MSNRNLFAVGNTAEKQPEPAAPPSFAAALAGTKAAPKPAAKKSSVPTLAATPEVKEAVDSYMEAKTAAKKAEADMAEAEAVIVPFVRAALDADGYAGRYHNSAALAGNKHQAKVIYANKFTLNPEDEGELAAILGESFADLITKKFNVKLKAAVFEDETLQAELMALIGDRFGDFFETETRLSVTEGFDQAIYSAVDAGELAALRTWARQYKPSIR